MVLLQSRRPRAAGSPARAPCCSQSRTGTSKPVLGRVAISAGKDCSGTAARSDFRGGAGPAFKGARSWKSCQSTRGTRNSSECAMLAQSESRSSRSRM